MHLRTFISIATVWIVLAGCGSVSSEPSGAQRDVTTSATFGEETQMYVVGGAEEECGSGAACIPGPNHNLVPDVVGMTVQQAKLALRREEYGCAVAAGLRMGEDGGPGPRRIVAQHPKPGFKGDEGEEVLPAVSKPYAGGEIPRSTGCIDTQELGITDRGLQKSGVFGHEPN